LHCLVSFLVLAPRPAVPAEVGANMAAHVKLSEP